MQFELPPSSEIVPTKSGEDGYRWIMSEQERARIASALNVDATTIPHGGNVMMRERSVCSSCGKHAGLDDLVISALDRSVHGQEFMLEILLKGAKENSPMHFITCSGCGTMHDGGFGCYGYDKWFA